MRFVMKGTKVLEDYYSTEQVLEKLQITDSQLSILLKKGEIRAYRQGDKMMFHKPDIDNRKKGKVTKIIAMKGQSRKHARKIEKELFFCDQQKLSNGDVVATIRLDADLDSTDVVNKLQVLVDKKLEEGVKHLLMADGKFMNSTGMATLLQIQDCLNERQGEMILTNMSSRFKSILQVLGILAELKWYETEEEALAFLETFASGS